MTQLGRFKVLTCSCGQKFIPPSACSKADLCSACQRKAQTRKIAEGIDATVKKLAQAKVAAEKQAAAQKVTDDLKHEFLYGSLPKGAKVSIRGRQVVIAHEGVSITFYTKTF